jgi:hypothetical protein
MTIKGYVKVTTFSCLVLACLTLSGCKSKEERFLDEAKVAATKFWEAEVFSKCGGEFGDYFGRRDGKIYQFRQPTVFAFSADMKEADKRKGVEWLGTTTVFSTGVRTFENDKWSEWRELKATAPRVDVSGKTTRHSVTSRCS